MQQSDGSCRYGLPILDRNRHLLHAVTGVRGGVGPSAITPDQLAREK